MQNIGSDRIFSASFVKLRAAMCFLAFLALFAQLGRATDALNYTKGYSVTGDYIVGGVGGLRGTGVSGFANGTINISGVPAGADIVAAFLYWQTVETTPALSGVNAFFDGNAIVGALRGSPSNTACWSNGGTGGSSNGASRAYRADVLRYLAVDHTNNVRLANGSHLVRVPDNGGSGNGNVTYADGASLVVVYRVLTPGTPLRRVVLYDGAFTQTKFTAAMTQTIGGIYQASASAAAKMTPLVAGGQSGVSESLSVNGAVVSASPFTGAQGVGWDNPTFNITLAANAASFQTQVTSSDNQVCLMYTAIVASANALDSDSDGLLDTWETNGLHLNDQVSPATFGGCSDYPTEPCVNLPAMGAVNGRKDIFVEIDWLHGTDGHLHQPKLAALNMIVAAFKAQSIYVHFDVGGVNYQESAIGPDYLVVPAAYAQGGEVLEESSLLCPNAHTSVCAFSEPYAVIGWKKGFHAIKDGFPALGLTPHFAHNRKDIFHYVLFAHALAGPFSATGVPLTRDPRSVSGVADRPGGDLMVTLGLWRSDIPENDQVGSAPAQAGTLMHELGHNLGLSHAGLYRNPNCMPNYLSIMNYLYQTRGLTAADGSSHVDFSYGTLAALNEGSLSETTSLGPLNYRLRYYGPVVASDPPNSAAKLHCDGTPITGGVPMIRLENSFPGFIDWDHNGVSSGPLGPLDVNYSGGIADGVNGTPFYVDSNDWGNLNLQQVGARLNVHGLSADVGQTDLGQTDLGQTDLGQTDLGQTDLGQTDLGQTDLGQTDLGQTDLGQTDLGQTDLGDVDYDTVVLSTIDPPPGPTPDCPTCGLTATNKIDRITVRWTAPATGHVESYNLYRSDAAHPLPAFLKNLPGGVATIATDDVVNSTTTLYNTIYTYYATSVVNIGGVLNESAPSNTASGIVKHLYVTALNPSRAYGDPNPVLYTVTGLESAGVLPAGASCTTTATSTSPIGTYPITCSGPATTSNPVDGITYTNGTLTITRAVLTITASTNTKTYDGTTSAAAIPTVTGLKGPDTVTSLAEAYDNKNAGTGKTLSVTAYAVNDGNGGNNYTVTTATNTTGVINPLPVPATIAATNKTYDTTNTASITSCSLTGVLAADAGNVTCSGTGATFASANAGTWTVTAIVSLSGSASGNYVPSSPTATTTATIFKATPTVTVIGGTFIHDGNPHPATGAVTGVGGALLGTPLFTYTPPGTSTAPVNVGSYLVTGSFPGNSNYNAAVSAPATININGFVDTASMGAARSYHAATLLASGKVLVTGGLDASGQPVASAEIYDPAAGTWTSTSNNMPNKAFGHTATLLGNGKVLVVGGGNSSSQLYDPASNSWSSGGGSGQRTYHTAVLLPNGKVLIAGGSDNSGKTTNTAQLYDPVPGTFSATGNMVVSRDFHTATVLPNGKVLIAGGRTSSGGSYAYAPSAELYDPTTGTFSATGVMPSARFAHAAALFNGKVLIAGGSSGAALSTAVLYDPDAGTFVATGSLATARQNFTATVISTGVLAAGGLNSVGRLASAEQYQGSAFVASDTMHAARAADTATLLSNGSVLVVGGQGGTGVSIATAELFVVTP